MLMRYQERDLVWIDLVAPTPAEVRSLMQEFDIMPHIAQELLSVSRAAKMERAGDTLLRLPLYAGLKTDDALYVCDVLRRCLAGRKP